MFACSWSVFDLCPLMSNMSSSCVAQRASAGLWGVLGSRWLSFSTVLLPRPEGLLLQPLAPGRSSKRAAASWVHTHTVLHLARLHESGGRPWFCYQLALRLLDANRVGGPCLPVCVQPGCNVMSYLQHSTVAFIVCLQAFHWACSWQLTLALSRCNSSGGVGAVQVSTYMIAHDHTLCNVQHVICSECSIASWHMPMVLPQTCAGSRAVQLDVRLWQRDKRWHCARSFQLKFGEDDEHSAELFFIDTSPGIANYQTAPWANATGDTLYWFVLHIDQVHIRQACDAGVVPAAVWREPCLSTAKQGASSETLLPGNVSIN